MANKSVFDVAKVTLKKFLFLFLLSVIYLSFVEAQGAYLRRGFKHLPARVFYFRESDTNIFLDYSGNVWISNNAGGDWWKKAPGVPENQAAALYMHPFSNDKAYILTNGKKHYKTSNRGDSWQEFTTELSPARKDKVLSFHAHREDFLLYRGTKCEWLECHDVTYYTTDGFSTSKKLLENTDNCLWAHSSNRFDEAPLKSIFCIQYEVSNRGSIRKRNDYRLVESEDFFEDKNKINIVDFNTGGDVRGIVGLAISQEYLVSAVKDINSSNMTMYVSTNGQTWARAFFPHDQNQTEIAYTLIESSSPNHLVIDVYESDSVNTGHLFISNSNGTYFVNRLDHTNRNIDGLVDFEHSQSVDGILLANIVSNYEEIDNGGFWAKKLKSKISFDDGITWGFIKPPKSNFNGADSSCDRNPEEGWKQGTCSLHLHSVTTQRNHGRIFSASEAPGVLMGVGNVGKYLLPYDQCDTFLSYDGGLTWNLVTHGAHMYEIGHYGSILVMVDDEQPTDYISYSHDHGQTWINQTFEPKIRVNKLMTDPKSTTKDFLLFGSNAGHDNGFNYFIFKFDFSKLFSRDCNFNDYEAWIANRPESNCFMGKETYYYRRKADARCFVSNPPAPKETTCACTRKDYECAPNYIFDKNNEICIPLVPEPIPEKCKDGKTKKYKGDSGYRIIPENLCDLGKPGAINLLEQVSKSCSEGHSGPPLYGSISHRTTNDDIGDYFYFPDSSILMIKTSDGKVKRSVDEGTTWTEVLTDAGPITYMFLHDHDITRAYFFPDKADSGNNYYMWYTTNRGENFGKTKLEKEPNKLNLKMLDFHPKNYDWLLFMASTPCPRCHSVAYFSPDNGKTWREIETWADKCIFGKDTEFSGPENDVVFCSSYKNKNSAQSQDELGGITSEANPIQLVKLKTDYTSKQVLLSNVIQFFIFNEFMAVATQEHGQLLLHMSTDGKNFFDATFPPDINVKKLAYTILQSTTGSVFLDAFKSLSFTYEYGSLFKSNSNGTSYNRILDNTNRNFRGNVDFEKVQGLDGIIIANQVNNVDKLASDGKKQIISLISRDDGFRWKRLKSVKTLDNDNSNCQDCYLNLHGRTEIYGPGAIYSAPSAIGLLIGVGNFGPYLKPYDKCNTFMSRDGGKTWTEIRRGPSLYEFGDQGTIIVVVDDKAPTNHIMYSWDYGKDWDKYIFTDSDPVRVSILTTNSNSTSMKFLLLGVTVPTSVTRGTKRVSITIDFSQLEKRKCGDDDFETWNPMNENSKDHRCLLGEEIIYQRRKADAKCHIKEYEIKPVKKQPCTCTKHDFECAEGYWLTADGECKLNGPDPDRPVDCKGNYEGHSGYVKMTKSKCKGGEENFDKMIEKSCATEGEIVSAMKVFSYPILDHFYFNGTKNIMVRTMDNNIWNSTDEGYTWKSVKSVVSEPIYVMFQHPYFNKYAYFITLGKTHYYTSDSGVTINKLEVPMEPNLLNIPVLDFHPEKPEYLIYTGSKDCENEWSLNCHAEAFYTKDGGKSWNVLEKYVRTCTWARDKEFKVDPNLIFCESFRDKKGSQKKFVNNPLQFVSSTNFFKTKDTRFENIVGLVTFEEFMVVAELLPSGQSLRLWVSVDAENFAEAQFPPNMPITQNAFTILESITHSVMLHVTTSTTNKYGNILKSNGNGTYYSLSLENANRDDRGYVDFEKMKGIQGIALANIVSNVQEVSMGYNKKLKSMITFNDGATWKYLKPPDGQKYCDGSVDSCSLHLHSYTERRYPNDAFSSSSAIGLMMGVGNVGDYLTTYLEGNTFLTKDAGFTWKEVKKGAYMYEFGDQGAIIVLADDENPTDHVFYSLDEGDSWSEYKFTDEPIRIFDIDTMPGGLSSVFLLRAISSNGEVIVHLNFTNVFPKTCELETDFEEWSPGHPTDGDSEQKCLFGHTITYLRKKPNTPCLVEEDPKFWKKRGENCECTEHDFECDYNYMRNATTGECNLVPGAQPLEHRIDEQCADGEEFWYDPTGYRKLKVSTCEGGPVKLTGEKHVCPGRHSALFWIIIVLSPFAILGISICIHKRRHERSPTGRIRLGSSIENNSILSPIVDIFYQIRMPRMSWLPGRRRRYRYSPVATDDGEVLMDNYDQGDNEEL